MLSAVRTPTAFGTVLTTAAFIAHRRSFPLVTTMQSENGNSKVVRAAALNNSFIDIWNERSIWKARKQFCLSGNIHAADRHPSATDAAARRRLRTKSACPSIALGTGKVDQAAASLARTRRVVSDLNVVYQCKAATRRSRGQYGSCPIAAIAQSQPRISTGRKLSFVPLYRSAEMCKKRSFILDLSMGACRLFRLQFCRRKRRAVCDRTKDRS